MENKWRVIRAALQRLLSWWAKTLCNIRQNFSGWNTDGSFTMAISNSFLKPQQKNPIATGIIVFRMISGDFLFYFDSGMLCVLIRIASMRQF